MEKHSSLASNRSSFNDWLHLTCFIVTKLIIDSVYFDNIGGGGGGGGGAGWGTPLH